MAWIKQQSINHQSQSPNTTLPAKNPVLKHHRRSKYHKLVPHDGDGPHRRNRGFRRVVPTPWRAVQVPIQLFWDAEGEADRHLRAAIRATYDAAVVDREGTVEGQEQQESSPLPPDSTTMPSSSSRASTSRPMSSSARERESEREKARMREIEIKVQRVADKIREKKFNHSNTGFWIVVLKLTILNRLFKNCLYY